MNPPAISLHTDHNGEVIIIVANKSGLVHFRDKIDSAISEYDHKKRIIVSDGNFVVYRGGVDCLEIECDDNVVEEKSI